MLFRNLHLFRLVEPLPFTPEAFELRLQGRRSYACGKTELFTFGWCSPFGEDHEVLTHAANGYMLFCALREEKLLPAQVIKDTLQEKIRHLETSQDRTIYKQEKQRLRDEVILDLLPRAFVRKQKTFVYIDPKTQLLIVDASSRAKAESVTILLRETLGKLNISPIETHQSPQQLLTEWLLRHQCSAEFVLADNCEMEDVKRGLGKIKCSEHDLTASEISAHIKNGKQVVSLGLCWQEKIAFTLLTDLSIKRIRYLDILQTQRKDTQAETAEEQLDADFSLMALELTALLTSLLHALGSNSVTQADILEKDRKTSVVPA
jgi:recombination associated protein RdgC